MTDLSFPELKNIIPKLIEKYTSQNKFRLDNVETRRAVANVIVDNLDNLYRNQLQDYYALVKKINTSEAPEHQRCLQEILSAAEDDTFILELDQILSEYMHLYSKEEHDTEKMFFEIKNSFDNLKIKESRKERKSEIENKKPSEGELISLFNKK